MDTMINQINITENWIRIVSFISKSPYKTWPVMTHEMDYKTCNDLKKCTFKSVSLAMHHLWVNVSLQWMV